MRSSLPPGVRPSRNAPPPIDRLPMMPEGTLVHGGLQTPIASERILFVDDEDMTRQAFRRSMRAAGLQVDVAAGGDEAMAHLRRIPYAVVACDLIMPLQDGLSLTERMRQLQPYTSYVLVTGATPSQIESEGPRTRGLTAVVAKPWNNKDLATVLRGALAKHRERIQSLARGSAQVRGRLLLACSPGEGSKALRELLPKALGSDVEIDEVNEYAMARESLKAGQFGVVLIDYQMPGCDGLISIEQLSRCASRTPIIVISDEEDESFMLSAMQVGAHDHLVKRGLEVNLLHRAVRYALDRKRAQERLTHVAQFDQLTGLANRTAFRQELKRAMTAAAPNGSQFSVLYLDLDRFKLINDSLGQEVGDSLLAATAMRLSDVIPEGDFLARLGGDEFALIACSATSEHDADTLSQRLLSQLTDPFELAGHEICMTASVGIALYPDDGRENESLLRYAEAAMRNAKARGRNTYGHEANQNNLAGIERIRLEGELRHALERDEYLLHYQPKVASHSGQLIGVEALLRWQPRGQDLVPPFKFIPILEDTGLIVPVGRWIVQQACEQVMTWQKHGLPFIPVSINLSARQFQDPNLFQDVANILEMTEIPTSCVELELTESMLMTDMDATMHTLAQLKSLGVSLSVDDFGTGYSSLAYLKRFPLDTLKIDRSFVKEIPNDPDDAAIAGAIIAMAHSLRLGVIAEGVETKEQLDFMRSRGCEAVQGFFFSRPLPPADLADWIAQRSDVRMASSA